MYRQIDRGRLEKERFPHTRGGVPDNSQDVEQPIIVFPTHVGVYRSGLGQESGTMLFSPHTWGCTAARDGVMLHEIVFPTHVGVYRALGCIAPANIAVFPTHVGVYRTQPNRDHPVKRFPHTRGGVPNRAYNNRHSSSVFPTHVGVYLHAMSGKKDLARFPHTRGGVPMV